MQMPMTLNEWPLGSMRGRPLLPAPSLPTYGGDAARVSASLPPVTGDRDMIQGRMSVTEAAELLKWFRRR